MTHASETPSPGTLDLSPATPSPGSVPFGPAPPSPGSMPFGPAPPSPGTMPLGPGVQPQWQPRKVTDACLPWCWPEYNNGHSYSELVTRCHLAAASVAEQPANAAASPNRNISPFPGPEPSLAATTSPVPRPASQPSAHVARGRWLDHSGSVHDLDRTIVEHDLEHPSSTQELDQSSLENDPEQTEHNWGSEHFLDRSSSPTSHPQSTSSQDPGPQPRTEERNKRQDMRARASRQRRAEATLGSEPGPCCLWAYYAVNHPQSAGWEGWRRRICGGQVTVDGALVIDPETTIKEGSQLRYTRRPWREPNAPCELPVLYEDEFILAVCKPSGLQVLPGGPFQQRTALTLLQWHASMSSTARVPHAAADRTASASDAARGRTAWVTNGTGGRTAGATGASSDLTAGPAEASSDRMPGATGASSVRTVAVAVAPGNRMAGTADRKGPVTGGGSLCWGRGPTPALGREDPGGQVTRHGREGDVTRRGRESDVIGPQVESDEGAATGAGATPVHRLGRGTSGILLCAKTSLAKARLSADFATATSASASSTAPVQAGPTLTSVHAQVGPPQTSHSPSTSTSAACSASNPPSPSHSTSSPPPLLRPLPSLPCRPYPPSQPSAPSCPEAKHCSSQPPAVQSNLTQLELGPIDAAQLITPLPSLPPQLPSSPPAPSPHPSGPPSQPPPLTAAAASPPPLPPRGIQKTYCALASGIIRPDWADVSQPIGRLRYPGVRGGLYAACPDGKPARSRVRVIWRDEGERVTLVEVDLLTGRPHQIRIHLAAMGHPLVGDPLYGVGGTPLAAAITVTGAGGVAERDSVEAASDPDEDGGHHRPCHSVPGDCGYWLHALRLDLHHPITGQLLSIYAPPPARLRAMYEYASTSSRDLAAVPP